MTKKQHSITIRMNCGCVLYLRDMGDYEEIVDSWECPKHRRIENEVPSGCVVSESTENI